MASELWQKRCSPDEQPLEILQDHQNPARFAPPGAIKGDFNSLCYAYNAFGED